MNSKFNFQSQKTTRYWQVVYQGNVTKIDICKKFSVEYEETDDTTFAING